MSILFEKYKKTIFKTRKIRRGAGLFLLQTDKLSIYSNWLASCILKYKRFQRRAEFWLQHQNHWAYVLGVIMTNLPWFYMLTIWFSVLFWLCAVHNDDRSNQIYTKKYLFLRETEIHIEIERDREDREKKTENI